MYAVVYIDGQMSAIGIIGAGSVSFTRTLVSDLLQRTATRDCELRLFDIDQEALKASHALVEQMRQEAGSLGAVTAASDLEECVRGVDYVICTILVGGRAAAIKDFEVASKYGLRFTVGDTLGVAGISRALRTVPALVQVAQACGQWAPGAVLLNYTNPMGMLVSAVGRAVGFPTVGLCHSAEYTLRTLASYLEVPADEVTWHSAGINHLAWVLSLEHQGQDLYPALAQASERQSVYDKDRARFELMKRFGYFVTESSKHVAEYLGFFIDKPEEVERLQVPVGEFLSRRPVPIATQLEQARGEEQSWLRPISNEYAPAVIAASESNSDLVFQGNIMNEHVIDNLSANMCVEAPCAVSKGKISPVRVGRLPSAPAALCQQSLSVQELTVEGVINKDRDLVYQAVMMDPQASALLTLRTMSQLVDDLLGAYPGLEEFGSRRLSLFERVPG
jgi:alpha-galactosidase